MLFKLLKIKNIFYFFLYLFFFSLYSFNSFSIENKIIVKIENQIITNIDINNEAKYLIALNPNLKNLNNAKIIEIAKNSLIREKIKEIEISKIKEIKIQTEYLNSIIENIYRNIGFTNEDDFVRYIKSFNISIDEVRKKISNEALWNQIIYKKFNSKIKINKEKIKLEIENSKFTSNDFLLYEIVYGIEKNNRPDDIHKKIKQSINDNGFENTASIFSVSNSARTGGKLGWINENSLSKKILREISNINIGGYTNPILIPGGFLILKVEDKKTIDKKIDFDKEFALRIRASQNQQLNQYSNIYYNKLKKNITINEN